MLRKTMIALLATASLAMLAPEAAMARGPGGGGMGGHGMGGHGMSMGGHGMSMGGMRGGSFNAAAIGGGSGIRSAAVTPNVGGNPGFSGRHDHDGHGWRGHGYGGFGAGLALGGLYGAYAAYGDPYYDGYYDNSYYDNSYSNDGGCYIVRQRVHTRYGWRVRPVQVCG